MEITDQNINLNYGRTSKKILDVICWCETSLRAMTPVYVNSKKLSEIFSPIGNKTGDFLRKTLLVRHGNYIIGQHPYGYSLNMTGLLALKKALSESVDVEKQLDERVQVLIKEIKTAYANEMSTGKFDYDLKSNRYFHRLQFYVRDFKNKLFADDYPHNYDIRASCVTVAYYSARRADASADRMKTLYAYLSEPQLLRQHIQLSTGLAPELAKDVINSINNGAKLIPHKTMALHKMLTKKKLPASKIIRALNKDPWIVAFTDELTYAWRAILQKKCHDAKLRAHYYFEQEKKMVDIAVEILESKGVRVFREHDGFRTDVEVDLAEIEQQIERRTEIGVKIIKV